MPRHNGLLSVSGGLCSGVVVALRGNVGCDLGATALGDHICISVQALGAPGAYLIALELAGLVLESVLAVLLIRKSCGTDKVLMVLVGSSLTIMRASTMTIVANRLQRGQHITLASYLSHTSMMRLLNCACSLSRLSWQRHHRLTSCR